MVSATSNLDMKKEFLVFLRNQDILSTSTRGVTTSTELHSGDNSTVTFNFTNQGVKNVRSVTVGGVGQTNYVDYDIDYFTGTITFTTAPISGTDNISISLDYGSDKIFRKQERIRYSCDSGRRGKCRWCTLQQAPV